MNEETEMFAFKRAGDQPLALIVVDAKDHVAAVLNLDEQLGKGKGARIIIGVTNFAVAEYTRDSFIGNGKRAIIMMNEAHPLFA